MVERLHCIRKGTKRKETKKGKSDRETNHWRVGAGPTFFSL